MGKIAVITDSNSGITQKQAEQYGVVVVPMPFLIAGETYFEDVTLTHDAFFARLQEDVDISTSQPSPETVMEIWDKALETSEEIVYIPMSSGLSGSCQTAIMLADDYDGKVQVVNNQRISVTQKQSVLDALTLADQGWSAKQIKEKLEEEKLESSIYIMIDTLKYLKKGGRITPAVAALGTALRLKPVLQIQGEKLDALTVAKTSKRGISKMLDAIQDDIEKRFDGIENVHMEVAHTCNEEAAAQFCDLIRERFGDVGEIMTDPLSLSVSCHIGPKALAIACTKKLSV